MVRLENLSMRFATNGSYKVLFENVNMTFPTGRSVALLGRNGAGKSTLMEIIAGSIAPRSGRVVSDGSISWPVGFAGSFHRDMTGAQNVRFIARIYGVDTVELLDFVADFAGLGKHFHMPVRSYSSGMRSRLAFGASMGIKFDTYLVDEVTSVGDRAFRMQSARLFKSRMEQSSAIVVTHSPAQVKDLCDAGAVLENGKLTFYEELDEALQVHEDNMDRAPV